MLNNLTIKQLNQRREEIITLTAALTDGLLHGISRRIIDPYDSVYFLFNNDVIDILKAIGSEDMENAIGCGDELGVLSQLIPDKWQDAVEDVRLQAINVISRTDVSNVSFDDFLQFTGEKREEDAALMIVSLCLGVLDALDANALRESEAMQMLFNPKSLAIIKNPPKAVTAVFEHFFNDFGGGGEGELYQALIAEIGCIKRVNLMAEMGKHKEKRFPGVPGTFFGEFSSVFKSRHWLLRDNRYRHRWGKLAPEEWRDVERLILPAVEVTSGSEDIFITCDDKPYLKIAAPEEGFDQTFHACVFSDFACIGTGSKVYFINLPTRDVTSHQLDGCFCMFNNSRIRLLAASSARVYCFGVDGTLLWTSPALSAGRDIDIDIRETWSHEILIVRSETNPGYEQKICLFTGELIESGD